MVVYGTAQAPISGRMESGQAGVDLIALEPSCGVSSNEGLKDREM